jgi:hypothetical protein
MKEVGSADKEGVMRGSRRKGKASLVDEEEAMREKAIEVLASAIVEDLDERQRLPLEPFEAYQQKIKFSLYADLDLFCTRFARGYRVLMEELERESSKH